MPGWRTHRARSSAGLSANVFFTQVAICTAEAGTETHKSAPCMQACLAGPVGTHRETAAAADMPAGRQEEAEAKLQQCLLTLHCADLGHQGAHILDGQPVSQALRRRGGSSRGKWQGVACETGASSGSSCRGGSTGPTAPSARLLAAGGGCRRLLAAAGCSSTHLAPH